MCYLQFPRGRGTPYHGAHTGKHQVQSGGGGSKVKIWAKDLMDFSLGMNGQGSVSRFRIS